MLDFVWCYISIYIYVYVYIYIYVYTYVPTYIYIYIYVCPVGDKIKVTFCPEVGKIAIEVVLVGQSCFLAVAHVISSTTCDKRISLHEAKSGNPRCSDSGTV